MMRLAVAVLSILILGPAAVRAQDLECSPVCNFTHYYGPYNYAYKNFPLDYVYSKPAVICLPVCDGNGYCSPTPTCQFQLRPVGRVLVRSRARP